MTSDEENRLLDERDRLLGAGNAIEKALLRTAASDAPVSGAQGRLLGTLARGTEPSRFPSALAEGVDDDRPNARRPSRARWLAVGALAVSCAAAWAVLSLRYRAPDKGAAPTIEPAALPAPEAPRVDPALANCPNPVVASGASPLIDDFEDGNARIALLEGRSGTWKVFNDRTGSQVPPHASAWHPALIPGGRGASRYALHTSGGVFRGWGMTGGFALAAPGCYDASAYDGVKFWAKGPGRIMFAAKMTQVVAVDDGGTCRENCYDVHRASIDLTKQWAEYTIRWRDLSQQGFGAPVAFDAKSLLEMAFFVYAEDTPFNFWIDDLSFVVRD